MSPVPFPIRGAQAPITALVTGASSGIGLAMVGHLLAHPGVARVIAVARRAWQAEPLAALAATHGARLEREALDLCEETAVLALGQRLLASGRSLELVFNAAGTLHGDGYGPEKSITQLGLRGLERTFAINAYAPGLLARALWPILKRPGPRVFASLSARVGSIADNRLGGWYAYRASKAAHNQLLRTLAIELGRSNRQACCVALHPGSVATPLSAPFSANVPADKLFSAERSASYLLAVIAGLGPEDNGRFIAWDGRDIPW